MDTPIRSEKLHGPNGWIPFHLLFRSLLLSTLPSPFRQQRLLVARVNLRLELLQLLQFAHLFFFANADAWESEYVLVT